MFLRKIIGELDNSEFSKQIFDDFSSQSSAKFKCKSFKISLAYDAFWSNKNSLLSLRRKLLTFASPALAKGRHITHKHIPRCSLIKLYYSHS